MPGIAVEIVIDAPIAFVWADVEDISSHVEWMQDAEEIRLQGAGTVGDEGNGGDTRSEPGPQTGPGGIESVAAVDCGEGVIAAGETVLLNFGHERPGQRRRLLVKG